MKLSIVIVNYNVKYFLEQCLFSVRTAMKGIHSEIFVVDNSSVDGSCQMIKEKFREVNLIENEENRGFSRANNQAIRMAEGEYILILNPDTVIEEETLAKCIEFMDEHPEAGGLGVKMIDGKGSFLPESKRALPTPLVAFFKIFGFSRLFPRSKLFSRYHLGNLDPEKTHEIEILPGAFMFLRKKALDAIGLFDEDFFLYGEDIDLSYRLQLGGYKNYYYPHTTIIHYKGESTKKGSLNYVVQFYKAMIIFASKHFSRRHQRIFGSMINLAIYFRAALSMVRRVFFKLLLPALDFLIIYLGFFIIKPLWEHYRFPGGGHYPAEYMQVVVPSYLLIWIISILLAGGYNRKIQQGNVIKGMALGTAIILIIYALLPVHLRFSRAMILLGSAWGIITTLTIRWVLYWIGPNYFPFKGKKGKRILIIGSGQEANRVKSILERTNLKPNVLRIANPENKDSSSVPAGYTNKLREIIRINRIEEIIFCSADIPAYEIIRNMIALTSAEIEFKIAPPQTFSIIGSNSIETTGEIYLIPLNSISKPVNRRKKRLFDVVSSLIALLLLPVTIFLVKKKTSFVRNIFQVILGEKTWVGITTARMAHGQDLPELRTGVIEPVTGEGVQDPDEDTVRDINMIYLKDYRVMNDIRIMIRAFKYLGNGI